MPALLLLLAACQREEALTTTLPPMPAPPPPVERRAEPQVKWETLLTAEHLRTAGFPEGTEFALESTSARAATWRIGRSGLASLYLHDDSAKARERFEEEAARRIDTVLGRGNVIVGDKTDRGYILISQESGERVCEVGRVAGRRSSGVIVRGADAEKRAQALAELLVAP